MEPCASEAINPGTRKSEAVEPAKNASIFLLVVLKSTAAYVKLESVLMSSFASFQVLSVPSALKRKEIR